MIDDSDPDEPIEGYRPGKHPRNIAAAKPHQFKPGEVSGTPPDTVKNRGRLRSLADMLARFGVKQADAKTMLEKLISIAKTGDLKALEMLLSMDKRLNPDMTDDLEVMPQHVQQARAVLAELEKKFAAMRKARADSRMTARDDSPPTDEPVTFDSDESGDAS